MLADRQQRASRSPADGGQRSLAIACRLFLHPRAFSHRAGLAAGTADASCLHPWPHPRLGACASAADPNSPMVYMANTSRPRPDLPSSDARPPRDQRIARSRSGCETCSPSHAASPRPPRPLLTPCRAPQDQVRRDPTGSLPCLLTCRATLTQHRSATAANSEIDRADTAPPRPGCSSPTRIPKPTMPSSSCLPPSRPRQTRAMTPRPLPRTT